MKRLMMCVGLALMTVGCTAAQNYSAPERDLAIDESAGLAASDSEASEAPRAALKTEGYLREAPLENMDMRVQRNGVIHVDSGNEMEASTRLRRQAVAFEAMVMSFNTSSVTFKMPSSRIESLIDVIENEPGWEIDELDFTAWDRTGEYFSVEARIETQTAIKERLTKLLESADTMDEVLKIGAKIDEVQMRIDELKTSLRDIKQNAGRVDVTIIFD